MKYILILLVFLAKSVAAAPVTSEINLDIGTPPVMVAKHSLAQRSSRLIRFYEAGVIGLGDDGMIKVHDGSRLTLTQSQIAGKLIDQENPERNSLIYAIAEAHGGKDCLLYTSIAPSSILTTPCSPVTPISSGRNS